MLTGWGPSSVRYGRTDHLRGALGAFLGLLVAGAVVRVADLGPQALPFLVAPMGASAVLLFAAPASPLAQPWAVVAGNVSSSLVGVAAARLVDDVLLAGCLAVGAAIAVMMALRCVHPPGGACALFAAVGGPAVHEQGFAFALWPVGANTVLLLAVAVLVNRATGRPYPHVPAAPPTGPGTDAAPTARVGLREGDVVQAMARLDQGLDVTAADVVALVREAEEHAVDRRLGGLTCEDVMARDVQTVRADETVFRLRLIMNNHHVKAAPVVDDERRVVGIATVYDLFNRDVVDLSPVSTVMSSPVTTVRVGTPVASLVALMTDRGLRHLPVLDPQDRLAGIVTRTELIAVMHRALVGSQG